MPYTLLQTGTDLRSVNSFGGLSSPLALPAGVTLTDVRTPRFARFKRYAIVVNTPSRPLSVDEDGVVRVLTPLAPSVAVALTGPNAGTLSGTYLALQTYVIRDAVGNIITESDYGPAMTTAVTIANKKLLATFGVSTDNVDGTKLYRTTTNGATYFPWAVTDDNTTTTYESDSSDAALGIAEGPSLGTPPDLTLIAEWAGRLWGVDRTDVDDLRYTEAGTMYAWSILNTLAIPHIGSDAAGITALIPRRNALGVARRDMFLQITGNSTDNFAPVVVNGGEQTGCVSQETVVVFNDVAYFLWRDGVYRWDSNGITSITNGLVRSWFATDTYFNKALYWRAFAQLEPRNLKYRLFLASAGSSQVDRWVEFDLLSGTWWGPHKTDAFTPSSAILVAGTDNQPYFMIGGREGYLSQEQDDKNDWGVSPITLSVETKRHDMTEPDYEKFWGELSVVGQVQTTGTIVITPSLGGSPDGMTAQTVLSYDMSQGRQRLGRLGMGNYLSLAFTHNTINQDVMLYGYEVNPVNLIGRR